MTNGMTPPAETYEALAADRARRWGYTETLDPDDLNGYVSSQVGDDNLRADVEMVWRLAVTAERERVRQLLTIPGLQALKAIPDGEIRAGCVVLDGATVRKNLKAAYRAIIGGEPS